MDIDKINKWLTLFSNIGVLAGILFLGLEIEQNSELMQVQIAQTRSSDAVAAQELTINSPYIPQIRIKVNNGEQLTPEESMRYADFFRASIRVQDNILFQYQEGMLRESEIRSIEAFVKGRIATPEANRQLWERSKAIYSDEYIEYVDSILRDIPTND
jgi:hypothetical protein